MLSTGLVQLLKINDGAGGLQNIKGLGYPMYILTILGICKILGVIAIVIPKSPLVKEWAYAGFFFIMSGAIFSHIASNSPITEILPSLLLLALTILSWYFRPEERKIS